MDGYIFPDTSALRRKYHGGISAPVFLVETMGSFPPGFTRLCSGLSDKCTEVTSVPKISCLTKEKCRQSFLCLHSLSDFVVIVNSPSLCQLAQIDSPLCEYTVFTWICRTNIAAIGITAVKCPGLPNRD